jgi:ABC-2 type transport system permease protein
MSTTPGNTSPTARSLPTEQATGAETSSVRRTLSLGWERTRWELRLFIRNRQAVGFTIFFPVMLLVLFGSIFGDVVEGTTIKYSQVLVAGIVASGAASVAFMNLAIGIATERDDGSLKRLAGTPMPKAAYFLGKTGLVLVTAVVEIIILLIVGVLAFGLSLPTSPERWAVFVGVLVLGVIDFALLGIALGGAISNAKAAPAVVNIPFVALQFVSGVYVPFWQLGSGIRAFASLFPLKWMAQGFRSVFLSDALLVREPSHSWQRPQTFAVLLAWAVIGTLLCARTFRWVDKK